MAMIPTDELTDGELVYLPPEAGDATQPRFEPVDDWLRDAAPAAQKTAMWQWFATRYEELVSSTPHDADGEYFFGMKAPPVKAGDVLRERFGDVVPLRVLDTFIADLQARGGDTWAEVVPDKFSG